MGPKYLLSLILYGILIKTSFPRLREHCPKVLLTNKPNMSDIWLVQATTCPPPQVERYTCMLWTSNDPNRLVEDKFPYWIQHKVEDYWINSKGIESATQISKQNDLNKIVMYNCNSKNKLLGIQKTITECAWVLTRTESPVVVGPDELIKTTPPMKLTWTSINLTGCDNTK